MTKVLTDDEFATVMREWYERNHGAITPAACIEHNAAVTLVTKWIARGDRAAIYRNCDLGHRDLGQIVCVSFGSVEAQIPTNPCSTCMGSGGTRVQGHWRNQHAGGRVFHRVWIEEYTLSCSDCFGMGWEAPPTSLPDGLIGIGWRYQLEGVFDGLTKEISLADEPEVEDESYDEISTHDGGED